MDVQTAVINRIKELCREKGYTPNGIAIHSGISQSTVKSILNGESQNPGIRSIKILCDGFDITIREFFNTKAFDELEQEIGKKSINNR